MNQEKINKMKNGWEICSDDDLDFLESNDYKVRSLPNPNQMGTKDIYIATLMKNPFLTAMFFQGNERKIYRLSKGSDEKAIIGYETIKPKEHEQPIMVFVNNRGIAGYFLWDSILQQRTRNEIFSAIIENHINLIENPTSQIHKWSPSYLNIITGIDFQKCKNAIDKAKEIAFDNEKQKEEQRKKAIELKEKQEKEILDTTLQNIKDGKQITGNQLILACEHLSISVPGRTKGYLSNKIIWISENQYQRKSLSASKSSSPCALYQECKENLLPIDPEVEKLFKRK